MIEEFRRIRKAEKKKGAVMMMVTYDAIKIEDEPEPLKERIVEFNEHQYQEEPPSTFFGLTQLEDLE